MMSGVGPGMVGKVGVVRGTSDTHVVNCDDSKSYTTKKADSTRRKTGKHSVHKEVRGRVCSRRNLFGGRRFRSRVG